VSDDHHDLSTTIVVTPGQLELNMNGPAEIEAVGDLNADGHDDMILHFNAIQSTSRIPAMVYVSDARGYRRKPTLEDWADLRPCALRRAGDLDDSGYDDFVTIDRTGSVTIAFDLATPNRAFVTLEGVTASPYRLVTPIAAHVDLDADGVGDLVIGVAEHVVTVFGDRRRRLRLRHNDLGNWDGIAALGDLDGDGVTDFAGRDAAGEGPAPLLVCSGRRVLGDPIAPCVSIPDSDVQSIVPLVSTPGARSVFAMVGQVGASSETLCEARAWRVRCGPSYDRPDVDGSAAVLPLACLSGAIRDRCGDWTPNLISPERFR
jgi:hypothetical protein